MINQNRIIKRDALNNALADAKRRNFKDSKMPPKSGAWKNEHSFKTATSSIMAHSDKIFVIGVEDTYQNWSLADSNWVVYTYDMDGNFTEKVHGQELGGKFFMQLTYLQ
jgi:hypothetical protein